MLMDYQKNKENYLAEWLEGRITDEELANIIGRKELMEYKKLRKSFDVLKYFNEPLDKSLFQIKQKIAQEQKIQKNVSMYKWIGGVAATLLLLAGLFQFMYQNAIDYQTGTAEQRHIVLSDNSKVILGANSKLTSSGGFFSKKRSYHLEGKAYFQVTKGDRFIVKTAKGNVEVLGTKFDIIAREKIFQVNCYEGKVKVSTASKNTYILTPETSVRVIENNEEKTSLRQSEPTWISGLSSFEEVPLIIVINELENQYGIEVKNLKNPEIKFSGSFPDNDLKLALASIFKPLHINYILKGKTVFLSEKNHNSQ